jgi:hypothetical protein
MTSGEPRMADGLPRFREMMRERAAREAAVPPVKRVRDMLGGHFADADSLDEVEEDFRSTAAITLTGIKRDLAALEAVLADPGLHDQLGRMVAWDANWVLEDPSDDGARRFLERVADMLRTILNRPV